MAISRREFTKLAGTTVVCACVVGAAGMTGCTSERGISDTPSAPEGSYHGEGNKVIIALSEVDALREVGGAVKLPLRAEDGSELQVIVVHSTDVDYRAFADRCTHKGKELNYLHQEKKLACSGLRSQFDLQGSVIRGPAEDPLSRYRLWREGEELVIEVS
ncbi:MAG: Rieske 2Fe-2S domain-containing protein [Anaerolineae bacterium]|jgi:Rieske Fe-S protein